MIKLTDISNLSDLISYLTEMDQRTGLWFRGHSRADWKLLPSLYRFNNIPDEIVILKKFKQSAHLLLERTPETEFDWLFWMQHYGVPTRLLDWTESPLAALYFAVCDQQYEVFDASIWILNPSQLNKDNNNIDDEAYIPSFDDEILSNYMPKIMSSEHRTKLLPMAAIATRNNPRIQAQLGVFSIFHRDTTSMEEKSAGCLQQIIIPSDSKKVIRSELDVLRFDKFSLFPELSSISSSILSEIERD